MSNGGPQTSKLVTSDEILEMLNECIDMACRVRESAYRVHITADQAKAVSAAPVGKEGKSVCFSTTAKDKITIIQEILKDTIESMNDFI